MTKRQECDKFPVYLLRHLHFKGATTLSIMTLIHIDTQQNDIQHNDTQHKDIRHNDTEYKDIHHIDTQQNDIQPNNNN